MSQPTRRYTRTRKAPQRFAEEDFETSKKSTDVPINFDVDGQEYFDQYDDAGRLWEVNLVTNEKVLLYDPANFGEVVAKEIQTSNQESKHPDSTITKRELVFKLEAKNCPEVSTVFLRHELENESEFYDEFCQACSRENVIQTLNTAIRLYKKENDITSWKRFPKLFTLKSVQTRERYLTPEGTKCGDTKLLSPSWGEAEVVSDRFNTLIFDGATFHFDVASQKPILVISEKNNKPGEAKEVKKERKVTFAYPPKKEYRYHPYPAEVPRSTFNDAVQTPLPPNKDLDAAETLLAIGFDKTGKAKKSNKRLKRQKKKLQKKLDRLENLLEVYKSDNFKLTNSLDKLLTKEPAPQYIFRQTYQKFSSLENRPIGIEYELYTNKLESPLVTIADLITRHPEFHFSDSTQEEYIIFSFTHLPSGRTYDTAFITKNKKRDTFEIILHNNQIDYDIHNFRKQLWWQFGSTLNYTIQIKQNIEKAIRRAVRRSRNRSDRSEDYY